MVYIRMYIMWLFSLLPQKAEHFDSGAVNLRRLRGVNACGVHAHVTQELRQTEQILVYLVVRSCKEVPEVMRENLLFGHVRPFA